MKIVRFYVHKLSRLLSGSQQRVNPEPDHQEGIICVVAFDRSSRSILSLSKGLRRIAPYASVVAPRRARSERDLRLASDTFLVIGSAPSP